MPDRKNDLPPIPNLAEVVYASDPGGDLIWVVFAGARLRSFRVWQEQDAKEMAAGMNRRMAEFSVAVADQILARVPPEASEMARDAAAVTGLDRFALNALADWLLDRKLDGLAENVRHLAVQGGDVLVVTAPSILSQEQRRILAEGVRDSLASVGRKVAVMVFDSGWSIERIRLEASRDTPAGR